MKALRILKPNVTSTHKLNTSRTPKDIGLLKFSKENDSIDPLNTRAQKTSLKQKSIKSDKRKHIRQKSDFKENSNNPLMGRVGENVKQLRRKSSANKEAGKCIKQIEQELSQLKRLTQAQNLAPASQTGLNAEGTESLLKIIKAKCIACPQFEVQAKRLLSCSREDKQTQTAEDIIKKERLAAEYERKIAEMKHTVHEMKRRMHELEVMCREDSGKIPKLENDLQIANEMLYNSQSEAQQLAVNCILTL